MNDNILSTSGKTFQKFISHLTQQLTRPKTKFIRQLLCGVLFSNNLILTNIASKVPCPGRLTAIAKRFRRQLADSTKRWCGDVERQSSVEGRTSYGGSQR